MHAWIDMQIETSDTHTRIDTETYTYIDTYAHGYADRDIGHRKVA